MKKEGWEKPRKRGERKRKRRERKGKKERKREKNEREDDFLNVETKGEEEKKK